MPANGSADCLLPSENTQDSILWLDVVDAASPRLPPLITVFADGRLAVRASPPSSRLLSGHITRAEVKALWDQIITTDGLLLIDSAGIAAAIGAPPSGSKGFLVPPMADAPWSFLGVTVPKCQHVIGVEGSALRSMARPDSDALQRFRRAEVRLLALATAVQMGE